MTTTVANKATDAQLELFQNDIKFILGTFRGKLKCYTREEVWTKIGRLPFGACYWVTSPTGENTETSSFRYDY